jgi:predicted DNA-binding protein
MPYSFRLDPDTEARIRRLSADTGKSRASVVREAVARYYAAREGNAAPAASAYDRLKAFVGVVRGGTANLSSGTDARYRASLRRKHRRAQRSR